MGVIFTKLHSRPDAVWKFLQLRDDSSVQVAELRDLFDDAFKYGSDPKRIRHLLRADSTMFWGRVARTLLGTPSFWTLPLTPLSIPIGTRPRRSGPWTIACLPLSRSWPCRSTSHPCHPDPGLRESLTTF